MPRFKAKSYDEFVKYIEQSQVVFDSDEKYDYSKTDQISRKTAIGTFMMDMMAAYAKRARDLNEDEKKADIEKLSTKIEERLIKNGSTNTNIKELADTQASYILKNSYNIVLKDGDFIRLFVGSNFKEVADFYKDVLGAEKTEKSATETTIEFSDQLVDWVNNGFNVIHEAEEPKKEEDVIDKIIKEEPRKEEPSIHLEVADLTNDVQTIVNKITQEKGLDHIEIGSNLKGEIGAIKESNEVKEIRNTINSIDEQGEPEQPNNDVEGKITALLNDDEYNELEQQINTNTMFLHQQQNGIEGYREADLINRMQQKQAAEDAKAKLEADKQAILKSFLDSNPGYPGFTDKLSRTIARIAKGEKIFSLQNDVNKDGDILTGNYLNSAKFVIELLDVAKPGLEVTDVKAFADSIKEDYDEKSLDSLNDEAKKEYYNYDRRIAAREQIDRLFPDCGTTGEFRQRFGEIIDGVIDKTIDSPMLSTRMVKNTMGVGDVASYLIKLMKRADIDPEAFGFDKDTIRNICDSKLDGELVSEEMERIFKKDLGIHQLGELTQEEYYALLDDIEPEKKQVAQNKLDGIKVDKNSPLLKDALSTYARFAEIHEKRSTFFWLFHPVQNITEYFAVKRCENTLKTKYQFTDQELAEVRNTAKTKGTDNINLTAISAESDTAYKKLVSEYKQRRNERKALLEAPLKEAEKLEGSDIITNMSQEKDFNKDIAKDINIEINTQKTSPKINIEIDDPEKNIDDPNANIKIDI